MTSTARATHLPTHGATHRTAHRLGAVAVLGLAGLALAPAAHAAEAPAKPKPTPRVWVQGHLAPGQTIAVYGDCGVNKAGVAIDRATVAGPGGIATMTPMADVAALGAELTVPGTISRNVTYTMTCAGGAEADITLHTAPPAGQGQTNSAKKAVTKKGDASTRGHQVVQRPRGAAATGGEPATDDHAAELGAAAGLLTLVAGAGYAARRRAASLA